MNDKLKFMYSNIYKKYFEIIATSFILILVSLTY